MAVDGRGADAVAVRGVSQSRSRVAPCLLAPVDATSRDRSREQPEVAGLQIVDFVDGTADDLTGIVEFRATYVAAPGDVRVLHERSRFVREDDRWYYLDGEAQHTYGHSVAEPTGRPFSR